jgi:hypothetical protein
MEAVNLKLCRRLSIYLKTSFTLKFSQNDYLLGVIEYTHHLAAALAEREL